MSIILDTMLPQHHSFSDVSPVFGVGSLLLRAHLAQVFVIVLVLLVSGFNFIVCVLFVFCCLLFIYTTFFTYIFTISIKCFIFKIFMDNMLYFNGEPRYQSMFQQSCFSFDEAKLFM
jgi:hypothetical protein